MAPPLQSLEGGTGPSSSRPKQRLRLRISDSASRLQDGLASLWRRHISDNIDRLIDSIPSWHRPTPPSQNGRRVPMSARWQGVDLIDERTGKPYMSNFIRSNRYTVWDFIPRQLAFQFMKIANAYFLVISIMQLIPGLSPVANWTTIAPLSVFVAFSMAKEGYDDHRRYRMDKVENRSDAWVLDPKGIARERESKRQRGRSWFGWCGRRRGAGSRGEKSRERLDDDDETAGGGGGNGTELRDMGSRQDMWSRVQWQDVRVGDVVRLRRDEQVPADLVVISATGPNGIAYIDTMALDGETNLKSKQACPLLAKSCGSVADIVACDATVVAEDPNIDIYSFDGHVTVGAETMPLTTSQVVFRGSTMRNTREACGMVINSGEECKIRMNASKGERAKNPAMQSITNRIILLVAVELLVIAVGLKAGNDIFEADYGARAWYMFGSRLTVSEQVIGNIILINTLIPISLYVSLEIVKIGQFFMLHDAEMYDPVSDTPMVANTTTIIENLGQISYVFSDKTGTLTDNIMRFRKLSTGGHVWNHDGDANSAENSTASSASAALNGKGATESDRADGHHADKDDDRLNTGILLEHLRENPGSALSEKALHFILCMTLCNTCLPEKKDDGSMEFQAASPDELALVQAARELGYVMVDRDSETITLQQPRNAAADDASDSRGPGQDSENGSSNAGCSGAYRILDLIEFNSDRKRMTVILRTPDGRILLLAKGADSALLPRLRLRQLADRVAAGVSRRTSRRRSMRMDSSKHLEDPDNPASPDPTAAGSSIGRSGVGTDRRRGDVAMLSEAEIFEACFRHIEDFASEGLRTLLFAYRYVDEEIYAAWKREYHEAETSLVDRQGRIDRVADKIERELELSGITAIEDKLQQGVPDTIDKLRRANIKVWMLTGDKRETAINIGHSARICKPFSDVFVLDASEDGNIDSTMEGVLGEVAEGAVEHSVVVIDGATLAAVEGSEHSRELLYELLTRVDAVICCRASPSQKAAVVRRIRERVPGSLTLAIGDGANDVAMIQASHVGVGISGREGLQAARISDYSFAQFRFLQRLLLVHGRWNYVRTCKYILGTFWKETVFYLVQAMYQRYNGYTGTSLYESASITVFNVIFTSLAVVLMGILEQDLSAETLLRVPELYMYGQRDKGFNFFRYLRWVAMGVSEAAIIWYTIYGVYINANFSDDDSTVFALGVVAFTTCVIFINFKMLLLELHNKTWLILTGFTITVAAWFLWNLALAGIYAPSIGPYPVRGSFLRTFTREATWWFAVGLSLLAAVVFELGVKSIRRVYWPTDEIIMQEIEHLDKKAERRAERSERRKSGRRQRLSSSSSARGVVEDGRRLDDAGVP